MKHIITDTDKDTLLYSSNYKYELELMKDGEIIGAVDAITDIGTYQIDSDSDVRRTFSCTLSLDDFDIDIEDIVNSILTYQFVLMLGVYNVREDDYVWYECGTYAVSGLNSSYDATNNSLSVSLSDKYVNFNGTRNGQVGGAPTIVIPNIDENGNKITIQQATVGVLKDNGINEYIVQDIGEFYGMEFMDGYAEYRTMNPNWNQLPYDLEYSCGCYVSDIFTDLRDMYPNCEMYYDTYGTFCFNMIPSCDNDPNVLEDEFLQEILIAENSEEVTYDSTMIKNVTEVFGKIYDIDGYAETSTYSSNIYTLTLEGFSAYSSGTILAFTATATNSASPQFKVNSLSAIPLYSEYTTESLARGVVEKDEMICVKLSYVNGGFVAYYLGKYQPHALCVLTRSASDPTYTKSFFAKKYNCLEKNITFRVEDDNPFTIQKFGEVFETKSGDEFDNIISDSVARANSVYYNKLSSTMNDIVILTTKLIPFLDVNVKVSYRKQKESEEHEYIVKSISHNLSDMTSNITLHRFYPLYFD